MVSGIWYYCPSFSGTVKILALTLLALFVQGADTARAKVFITKTQALELLFPEADDIEKRHIFLTESQLGDVRRIARTAADSKFYTFYVARSEGKETGYAVIDTHSLRTLTETVMFVINPDGSLRRAEILAFFEPGDYMPSKKWINLFLGKKPDNGMKSGADIPNVTGATITADSFSRAARRVLAVHRVAFGNPADGDRRKRSR